MHRRAAISLLLGLAGALSMIGCGSSDETDGGGGSGGTNGTGDGGSCTGYAGATECVEYTGADWNQTTAGYHCQGMQGTHSPGPCDQTGAVGRCTITAADPLEYYHYYYERAAEAEHACGLNNGVWEPL